MKTHFSIIIVDDDKDDHLFLINAIAQINPLHRVISFYSGQTLMNYLEKQGPYENIPEELPDLIMLDLYIPGIDGYEILKRIRGRSKFKNMNVFVLTTCSFEYDRIKSIAYGCNNFYSKPTDPDELVKIMEDVFSQVNSPSLSTSVLT
jgi:two-component system response regulator